MNIKEFVNGYKNHPILFVGAGLSLRYLTNSYTWEDLLKRVMVDLTGNDEKFYTLKSQCLISGEYRYDSLASLIEKEFNEVLTTERYGRFKHINDTFFENMRDGIQLSRFKIYVTELIKNSIYQEDYEDEINQLLKASKNIGSIITTNYDNFIEETTGFVPLIGNEILLSNPYGAVYKIHGCISKVNDIVITKEDYNKFDEEYELIRAQLLSLFIHNPIIFIGYGIGDENIRKILQTIFKYIKPNSNLANNIKQNFLLVEFEKKSNNQDVVEHDILLNSQNMVRINKIKTDDFTSIYKAISNISLPISAMDIKRVESIVRNIKIADESAIKVQIQQGIEALTNSDKILFIGAEKSISYKFHTVTEILEHYFEIIQTKNVAILDLINQQKIKQDQWIAVYGFNSIGAPINDFDKYKLQQDKKLQDYILNIEDRYKTSEINLTKIEQNEDISNSNKIKAIIWTILNNQVDLNDLEDYIINYQQRPECNKTEYRKIICAYDYKKYRNQS